jgi:hypothetical protein
MVNFYSYSDITKMAAEKRYFEEEDHVALYAASRPTVPLTLMEDITAYCNRNNTSI